MWKLLQQQNFPHQHLLRAHCQHIVGLFHLYGIVTSPSECEGLSQRQKGVQLIAAAAKSGFAMAEWACGVLLVKRSCYCSIPRGRLKGSEASFERVFPLYRVRYFYNNASIHLSNFLSHICFYKIRHFFSLSSVFS